MDKSQKLTAIDHDLGQMNPKVVTEKAAFGMSWFWFPEAKLAGLPGVITSKVGYTGGSSKKPTYRNMGDHTETVEVTFDPSIIPYHELLKFFWKNHNPFTKGRPQYMSAIFCHGQHQLDEALASKQDLQKHHVQPISTKIMLAEEFYDAEDYHQKYLLRQHPKLLKSLKLSDSSVIKSYAAAKINAFINNDSTRDHLEEVCKELGLKDDQITYIRRKMDRR